MKSYTIKGNLSKMVEILKFLRNTASSEYDYKVLRSNYKFIQIEFNNEKLELEFAIKYYW